VRLMTSMLLLLVGHAYNRSVFGVSTILFLVVQILDYEGGVGSLYEAYQL
jgi:hypothetical protein